MALRVIDKFWFTNQRGTVGMVITENEMGVKKIRIGSVAGFNEKNDADYLAAWGSRVPKEAILEFVSKADK